MTKPFFNAKDAKYECCLDLLHVKTAATIICVLAALLHLVYAYDIFCDDESLKSLWIPISFLSIYVFGYVFALFGIIYSKPEFIDMAVVFTRVRIIVFGALSLLLLGALFPSTSVKQLCRYLIKLLGVKDKEEIIVTLALGLLLLHFAVLILVDLCVYYILSKCRQYYIDKAAYDKLTLPQSKSLLPPPPYKV